VGVAVDGIMLLNAVIELGAILAAMGMIAAFLPKIKKYFTGDLLLRQIRLELLNYIQHFPEETVIITSLYDEYVKKGGNSHMIRTYQIWADKYLDDDVNHSEMKANKERSEL
jgi:hypothetical protein